MPTLEELRNQTPATIHEALECMERTLQHFCRTNDFRAVFLHAYYLITRTVRQAIDEHGANAEGTFRDSIWMSRLAGKFATLYFRSLSVSDPREGKGVVWEFSHRMARENSCILVQDLLMGITAHIKYDLAVALYLNICEHGDQHKPGMLDVRKEDHYRANHCLFKTIPEIVEVLSRDYGSSLRTIDRLTLGLDRHVAMWAVSRLREAVWEYAMDLLSADDQLTFDQIVQELDREATSTTVWIRNWLPPLPTALLRSLSKKRQTDLSAIALPAPPPSAHPNS